MDDLKKEVPIVSRSFFYCWILLNVGILIVCSQSSSHVHKYWFIWQSFLFTMLQNYIHIKKKKSILFRYSYNNSELAMWKMVGGVIVIRRSTLWVHIPEQETDSRAAISGCPDILISQVTCMCETYLIWFRPLSTHLYCMHKIAIWKITKQQKHLMLDRFCFFFPFRRNIRCLWRKSAGNSRLTLSK